ncbi:MAG: phosphoglucosamine mutase [Bacteroidetes bacterium]|nr:phosphoglucosamine mutase [Bacteroidota bacterium]
MSLIKSISGIRGTIGGKQGDSLTPLDVVKFTSSFGYWLAQKSDNRKIVVGRDARLSGEMVNSLVCGSLVGLGFEVIDLGLSTTPTVELAVVKEQAAGGIILPAAHNPKQWNAWKLLTGRGEFISGDAGAGVKEVVEINCEPTGKFAHNPEPLPENLTSTASEVKFHKADLGIVVDPDVDRLAMICEDGSFFGEEYSLVAIADYILKNKSGNTVSNLSSTRALKDVTEKYKGTHFQTAVGEVNVVTKMKEVNAVIGGEGNGGIIYPELHYGRDAMVGIALFLTHLAKSGQMCSILRNTYPNYFISKNKIDLSPEVNIDHLMQEIEKKYAKQNLNKVDGLKIEFDREWVHLRRSNTEPIIRIYAESESESTAEHLAKKIMTDITNILKGR